MYKIILFNYFRNETKLKYEEIEQPIQYDCFIICYKDTFHENDLKIARQIRGRGLNFFLVRTHMDKAVEDQEGILGRTLTEHDKKDLIKEIRDNANKCLVAESLPKDVDDDRYIFLVSALLRKVDDKIIDDRNKFDFERLQFEIQNKLKGEKKTLFIYSLFNSCEQNIKLKCQSLRSKIKWAALTGSAGGAIPVPGVSAVVDGSILSTHCLFYMQTLGIFVSDFKKTAESFRVNYSALKENVLDKNSLVKAILELSESWGAIVLFEDFIKIALKEGSKHLTRILVEYLAKQTILNSAEELLKSVLFFFPGIGTFIASIVGASISFLTTSYSLNVLLDCFENVLLEVVKYCKDFVF